MPLYKSIIVIWSDFDPSEMNLEDIGREAEFGEAYCSFSKVELIEDPASDLDYDEGMTEFFYTGDAE